MTSVGDTLRRERLQRKLDLDQISHELKISRRMLDAIEADQYERLPGGVFAKAFVRQYAGMLGLDGEELANQVQRAMAPPSSFDTEEKPKPALSPIEVSRVEEWTSLGDRSRSWGSLPAAVLVVVAMLICSAVYAWMQRPRAASPAHVATPPVAHTEPAPTPAQPVATPPMQTAQTAPVSTPAETPAAPATQPAPTPTAASQPASPQPDAPTGPVHVEMVADDAVWVLVRVDGKFAYTGVIDAGSRKVFDGAKDVQVRLGNAGGISISLNGKPIGSTGPKGQVRNVQFTSGGFQIESPKPAGPSPLDPLDR